MTNEELLCVLEELKNDDINFGKMLESHAITFPKKDEAYTFFTADGWIDHLSVEQQEGFVKYFEK